MKPTKKPIKEDDEISYATNKKNLIKTKLVFVGDQAVGKSSIINRFIKDAFDPTHNPTVGIDFVSKNLTVEGSTLRLQLWDTAGQERFKSLIPGYLRDCQAALLVVDLSQKQTFESLSRWIDFVKDSRGQDALIYILGNKCDLTKENESEEVTKFKKKMKSQKFNFFEVSAKDGTNIQKVFKEISSEILNVQNKTLDLSIQMQKSKVIQVGIPAESSKKQPVKLFLKKNSNNTSIVLKDHTTQRVIKQKRCC